ncbi:MAG TPA: hypothetical protein VFL90_01775 [Methylomirabilota bacterium]|nr:hypothetical protein [Methylomirabilota bacterium]
MTLLRLLACLLLVAVVAGPVLGFVDGDRALQIWYQHPRHAAGHAGAPHGVWKTAPAATPTPRPRPFIAPVALRVADPPAVVPSVSLRPPFVPPRG